MKKFAALFTALDRTTKTSKKVDALASYFETAPPDDAAWALFFLSGRRLKRLLPAARLASFAATAASLSDWLFAACCETTGDFAEAAALVLPVRPSVEVDAAPSESATSLSALVREGALPLRTLDEAAQRDLVVSTWAALDVDERFVWNKILTGAFRVGVSELLVLRGIAQATGVDAATLKHRSMGDWNPDAALWAALTTPEHGDDAASPTAANGDGANVTTGAQGGDAATATRAHDGDDAEKASAHAAAVVATTNARAGSPSRPYPFCLAHPLPFAPSELGERSEWQVEWKWDGIRGQVVRRDGVFVWSRGEELVTEQFPEVVEAAAKLPRGTVVDGELLPWKDGVRGFSELQRRLNRKKIGDKLLAEVPVAFLAYDLLEHEGKDVRPLPLVERRALLEDVVKNVADPRVLISEIVREPTWEACADLRRESRARRVEGFMLKRLSSRYGVGRKRGDWWKWKIDPYSVDAVLIYAQHGSGKRASLYSDYTFGVWRDGALVPFAKAYSGLTDDEIKEVDAFVRRNTVEKFGPVHRVTPELVFELGFEGIAASTRHKSGVAVRFPRMLRWRKDKHVEDADTLASLLELLKASAG